jgi:hypothetical protein
MKWLSRCWRTAAGLLLLALSWAVTAPAAGAQTPPREQGWDVKEVRELVARAIERRGLPLADTLLRQYSARADGTVQFLLESEADGAVLPLRLDQVSVDLYWQAPDRTRQVIRALRKQDLLPIRQFHYYADRLTMVQEGFGDRIAIGEERDVRGVPHPLAPGAADLYHYRTADTLTLRVPGLTAPISVVRVEVRPRDPSQPRFSGDVFVDARSATLVRMRFTFTPAAYVDPRTDRIFVSVEHALWEGRYWLPYRQELEVRRQAPEVDFGVSTVIRAQLSILDYDFETPVRMPEGMPRIIYPAGEGDTGRFAETLDEIAVREGLRAPSPAELAEAAARMPAALLLLRREAGGLPPVRLYAPSASSVLRANRAEGTAIGGGISVRPAVGTLLTLQAGFATGPEHPTVRADFGRAVGSRTTLHATARRRDVQEIEPAPPGAQFINTMTTLLAGRDWLDLYYVDGGGITLRRAGAGGRLSTSVGVQLERHTPATRVWASSPWSDRELRPVLAVEAGTRASAVGSLGWRSAAIAPAVALQTTVLAGAWGDEVFATMIANGTWRPVQPAASVDVLLLARGGAAFGAIPPQHLFLPAGPRTLPGHGAGAMAGSRFLSGGGGGGGGRGEGGG